MASPRRSAVVHCRASSLALVLLGIALSSAGAFVSSSLPLRSCFHAWGYHEGSSASYTPNDDDLDHPRPSAREEYASRKRSDVSAAATLARRVRRRSTWLAAAPDGLEASDNSGSEGSSGNQEDGEDVIWSRAELPMTNDVQVKQATRAVWQALSDGKTRQILRLSLPLIGKTEIDDWPGGDRQRYKACRPMVESLLRGNPAAKEGASVVEQILDESDAVGLMQLQCKEAKDDASAMIFPTTDTLPLQQQVAKGAGSRLVALVNPAWKTASDFGLFKAGEAKKALSEFKVTYSLQSLVVYGYTLRLLYCYPGPWRLFLVGENTGRRELLGSWEQSPANEDVEKAVFDKKGKPNASDRLKASAKFFQDSL